MFFFCYIERVSRSDNSSSSNSDGLDVLICSDCNCIPVSLHFLHGFVSRDNVVVSPTPPVLTISDIHSLAVFQSVFTCSAILCYSVFRCDSKMC